MIKKTIHILNGPNLNLIGTREPEVYGKESLIEHIDKLKAEHTEIDLHHFQSNHEGEIIDYIHKHGFTSEGFIINPGAFAHYSFAIADAILSVRSTFVEVHISNVYAREEYRKKSVTAANCKGLIAGFGLRSYDMALLYFLG